MQTLPVETYKAFLATAQEAAGMDRSVVIKQHGDRFALYQHGVGGGIDLPAIRRKTLNAADPASFAAIIQRSWPDPKTCPTIYVACHQVEARVTEPVKTLLGDKDRDGSDVQALLPTPHSETWTKLKEFLTTNAFTTREAILYRAKLAAWLSPDDLARWHHDFRNLTKKVTSEAASIGLGTIGTEFKMTERSEVTTGLGVDLDWFNGIDFAAKLYDFSETSVTVRAMITEAKEPEKWVARAIGNAINEAELNGRRQLAEQLKTLLPTYLVVVGEGEKTSLLKPS